MTQSDDIKTSSPISRRRIWLFRLIALTVIPAVILITLEISLRVVGYGYDASALRKIEWKGQPAYCNNFSFGWRFWPRTIARQSEPYTFTADKAKDTYRIFILGGSAALGTPEPSYSFSRSLEVMLEKQYPQVNFEVINTAITAINSHVVLPIAKACAPRDGDLYIVYLGNNEVIGPYGAGTIFAPLSDNITFVRLDKAVKSMRFGQLLNNTLSRKSDNVIPKAWAGSKMFMENLIRKDNSDLQVVYSHYKRNLEDITRAIRKTDSKMILCSVGSNLKDNAPFASLHRLDLTDDEKSRWVALYEEGIQCEDSDQDVDAIKKYLSAAKIDNTYADLHFRLARAYLELDDYEKSREEYILARELDTLRLRADNGINRVVHEVAQSYKDEDVYFVDTVKAFEASSPHGIPGEELFYEHVHLNFKGNYVLARTVFDKVETLVPNWVKNKRASSAVATEQYCGERLAYTDWDKYIISEEVYKEFTINAPFDGRLYNDELAIRNRLDMEERKRALDIDALKTVQKQYLEAIGYAPSDWFLHWKYGNFLSSGMKDLDAAAEQYRITTEMQPYSYPVHATYGLALLNSGNYDSSIASSMKALQINPTFTDAIHVMGIAYSQKGNTEKAIECFSREIKLRPDQSDGYNRMGVILDTQGDQDGAEDIYRKGLSNCPGDVALYYNLAFLLAKQNRFDEALETLNVGLKAKPNSVPLRGLLNKIMTAR